MYRNKFSAEKAIEAMLYLADKVTSPSFHMISKLLYFSDKKHLENYGRFILGDEYIAMKHGPVPSATYDILKSARGDGFRHRKIAQNAFSVKENYILNPLRPAQLDILSESELECLNFAIKQYGSLDFSRLTEISHDDAWNSAGDNDLMLIENIAAILPNSKTLLQYLRNPYSG